MGELLLSDGLGRRGRVGSVVVVGVGGGGRSWAGRGEAGREAGGKGPGSVACAKDKQDGVLEQDAVAWEVWLSWRPLGWREPTAHTPGSPSRPSPAGISSSCAAVSHSQTWQWP